MNDQFLVQQATPLAYFHIVPNLADEELDPFEYRLLGHYLRVCGQKNYPCRESVRTTAERCKMSHGKVITIRDELARKGYLQVHELRFNGVPRVIVTLVDFWKRNMLHFASQPEPTRQPSFAEVIEAHLSNGFVDSDNTVGGHCVTSEIVRNGKSSVKTDDPEGLVGHVVTSGGHVVTSGGHVVTSGGHVVECNNNHMKNNQLEEKQNHHHHQTSSSNQQPKTNSHDDDGQDARCKMQGASDYNLQPATCNLPNSNPPPTPVPPPPSLQLMDRSGQEVCFPYDHLRPVCERIMERMHWTGTETYLNRLHEDKMPMLISWLWVWRCLHDHRDPYEAHQFNQRNQYDPFANVKNPAGKVIKQVSLGNMPQIADELIDALIEELQKEQQNE